MDKFEDADTGKILNHVYKLVAGVLRLNYFVGDCNNIAVMMELIVIAPIDIRMDQDGQKSVKLSCAFETPVLLRVVGLVVAIPAEGPVDKGGCNSLIVQIVETVGAGDGNAFAVFVDKFDVVLQAHWMVKCL
ncbi:hypothetical protein WICMUC_003912 [Wickerhamomyces mucosus]|uniref:Uncharacterized protein n=1 Tax=Wickerhamomyces mucosus TaxID=1378264 RepID=A0A9P8PKR3_9ASCO|nr:hypothetical protein WICMUC_003912 [Wickerhamomyces mucosus]